MPVHTQNWQPLTMAPLLSFYSTRREGVCSVPSVAFTPAALPTSFINTSLALTPYRPP
jgi:hypothetical protein